jgi:hypothetical protein
MLGDGQQFHVGEALRPAIVGEQGPHLPVTEEVAVGAAAPRAQVHLIDRHGRVLPIDRGAPGQPVGIAPGIAVVRRHQTGGLGAQLEGAGIGVHLDQGMAALGAQLELVQAADPQPRYEQFPDPGAAPGAHGVDATIPIVEVSHYARPLGAGGPDGEPHPGDAVHLAGVGAQHPVGVPVVTLAVQVQV